MDQIFSDDGVLAEYSPLDSSRVSTEGKCRGQKQFRVTRVPVVLMHEPDVADELAAAQVEALQLSGHTHGGQLRLMGLKPMAFRRARWGKKYLAGGYEVGSMQVYVNRGIGCVGVPLRVWCPPEITEITLRSPSVVDVLDRRPRGAVIFGDN